MLQEMGSRIEDPLAVQEKLAWMEVAAGLKGLGSEERDLYRKYPGIFNMSTLGQLANELNAMAVLRCWQRKGLNPGETPEQIALSIRIVRAYVEHPTLKKFRF